MLSDLQKRDLKYIFHPCSQMKDYEKFPPVVIEKGEGIFHLRARVKYIF